LTSPITITIAANAITAKLIDPPRDAKLHVQHALSYLVAGFEHMTGVGRGWDGRASFFEFNLATFPAGFVYFVQRSLIQQGYRVNLVRRPFPAPLGPVNPIVDAFPEDPRYDYQAMVVDKLLKHGQIIAQVATGGGKSRIAKLAYARIKRPTLFLTTRGILMHQMKNSFVSDLKIKVGTFGDDEWTSRPQEMNVGMVQTFAARLKDGDPRAAATIELLERFEFVILEEAHESSGNSYYDILRHCKNAHYRLALTATPFMKDSEEANMRLHASSGPVAIKVSEKTLIERGILAKPYFKFIDTEPVKNLYRSTPWQRAYELGISQNPIRNSRIVKECVRAVSYGLTTMVLVQHKAHGKSLSSMLTAAGVRCNFIMGEHDQAERQASLNALKDGRIDVLIGSTILDVGVDVPAVGMIILAGGGKAEVALRQRIGRGLRSKKTGANVCFVIDFADPLNNHLRSHSAARRSIIESTEGFAEGILPRGADFDFAALGFSPSTKR
jgi:superfamily II DNA or RNA helicase